MHPDVMWRLFVEEKAEITADGFFALVRYEDPKNENETKALDYFKGFVSYIESKIV